ncbi:MAG: ATP-binding protein [Planctomycetes bacterium]|nr:ATP-binding protein [Planctomycetota bacterium]MCB9887366.1 ATP-binding protein [Planctomycetota bacterium]
MDHLRLVWQTGETLLESVVFDEDPEGTRYNVLLALQEMVTNVLRHAYQRDESKPVEVTFELANDSLEICLRDQGPAFNPLSFDTEEQAENEDMPTACGGFGIHIARVVMDEVSYARDAGCNVLRMRKFARVKVNI